MCLNVEENSLSTLTIFIDNDSGNSLQGKEKALRECHNKIKIISYETNIINITYDYVKNV